MSSDGNSPKSKGGMFSSFRRILGGKRELATEPEGEAEVVELAEGDVVAGGDVAGDDIAGDGIAPAAIAADGIAGDDVAEAGLEAGVAEDSAAAANVDDDVTPLEELAEIVLGDAMPEPDDEGDALVLGPMMQPESADAEPVVADAAGDGEAGDESVYIGADQAGMESGAGETDAVDETVGTSEIGPIDDSDAAVSDGDNENTATDEDAETGDDDGDAATSENDGGDETSEDAAGDEAGETAGDDETGGHDETNGHDEIAPEEGTADLDVASSDEDAAETREADEAEVLGAENVSDPGEGALARLKEVFSGSADLTGNTLEDAVGETPETIAVDAPEESLEGITEETLEETPEETPEEIAEETAEVAAGFLSAVEPDDSGAEDTDDPGTIREIVDVVLQEDDDGLIRAAPEAAAGLSAGAGGFAARFAQGDDGDESEDASGYETWEDDAPDGQTADGDLDADAEDAPEPADSAAVPDAQELEETIRRVVREELAGEMGQRLSQNIQRMIRDQIAEVMRRRQ